MKKYERGKLQGVDNTLTQLVSEGFKGIQGQELKQVINSRPKGSNVITVEFYTDKLPDEFLEFVYKTGVKFCIV